MTLGSNLDIITEISSKSLNPIVIWYRNGGHFQSVIISETQDDTESVNKPEFHQPQSLQTTAENYDSSSARYDIANPLITREILDTLSIITAFSDSEGILPSFSNLLEEISEVLKSLNEEIFELLVNNPDKVDELKQPIIEDMKNLSTDIEIEYIL